MITALLERQYIAAVTDVENVTVNTAVNKVNIVAGTDLTLYDKSNSQKSWFQPHDGVLIKSLYVRMPYQFTLADAAWFFGVNANVNPATAYSFPEIGEPGSSGVCCPMENYEVELNTYVAPPPAAVAGSLKWQMQAAIVTTFVGLAPSVSMVGVPASLNGLVLPIYVGMKIVHAYPITASP